jgi:thioredoxin reductase
MSRNGKRLVVIGAGPIGVETALYAIRVGFEVEILERGQVGQNMLDWGHVKLFSPWSMNHTRLGVETLHAADHGWSEPAAEECLTGREYVEAYLRPLSETPKLTGRIRFGHHVEWIGRRGILKHEGVGQPERAEYPFTILCTDANGVERKLEADILIDTTGVYGTPNWLGDGGVPAVGERSHRSQISYFLDDILGADRRLYAHKAVLLVGNGHSAATSIVALRELVEETGGTSVVWVVRHDRHPVIQEVADDPLPERARLASLANEIAAAPAPGISVKTGAVVERIESAERQLRVVLRTAAGREVVRVDRILANVGYGPDNSLYRELQVHECYASRGPMKLAAALLGSNTADCLAQGSHGPDTLRTPEPNFFILGNKSYGRTPNFLLRVGYEQIRDLFTLLSGDPSLDLYGR